MRGFDDDLLDPDIIRDPSPYYAKLRRERPVHFNTRWRGWVISRYDDVYAGLHDDRMLADTVTPYFERMSAEKRARFELTFAVLTSWVVFQDPPRHTQLRRLFSRAFSPRAVARMREVVQEQVSLLLDTWEGRSGIDFSADFAYPLPANVIATMIGAPREDMDKFHHWADVVTSLVHGGVGAEEGMLRAQTAIAEFKEYLLALYRERAAAPREDMISWLLEVQREGGTLTPDDVVYSCMLLLSAGHETTQSLMTNTFVSLLDSPDQARLLVDHPEHTKTAIEECLRFNGPMKGTMRAASEDLQVRGVDIKKGDRILLLMASANRDEEKFAHPERLDVTRNPNPHLSFGHGLHFCLGSPLARLEMEIGLRDILKRFPRTSLREPVKYAARILSRSIEAPVHVQIA